MGQSPLSADAPRPFALPKRYHAREARLHVLVIAVLYGIFGASIFLQGRRWLLTPAYRNIFSVLPQQWWGVMFLGSSVGLFVTAWIYPRARPFRLMATTSASVLTVTWLCAFVVRWLTSDSTTPETWGSFAVDLYLLWRAAHVLNDPGTNDSL